MKNFGAYYNDNDPYVCRWLENLILFNVIPNGVVDPRPIQEVKPKDVEGFSQCHFFAGIGGWAYAFRLAGWPDDRPVWTGSCPCQPFSIAGKGKAQDDHRHLWPAWFKLIKARRPVVCFGEQVSSIDGLAWLDIVQADLDETGYTCGALDLCAAGVGAPHWRQRLYWVADTNSNRFTWRGTNRSDERVFSGAMGKNGGLADGKSGRRRIKRDETFPADRGLCGRVHKHGITKADDQSRKHWTRMLDH